MYYWSLTIRLSCIIIIALLIYTLKIVENHAVVVLWPIIWVERQDVGVYEEMIHENKMKNAPEEPGHTINQG